MIKINVQVLGGEIKQREVAEGTTVGTLKRDLGLSNHLATVNGETTDDSRELEAFEFVMLSPNVKGGC